MLAVQFCSFTDMTAIPVDAGNGNALNEGASPHQHGITDRG